MLIKTIDLWKTYIIGAEEIHAVQGVSVDIDKGEYVAIMGPSGSGKSTLMNVIGCLDTPTRGEYHLNGRRVSTMSDDELAYVRNKEIGFVFQFYVSHKFPQLPVCFSVRFDSIGVISSYVKEANISQSILLSFAYSGSVG